MKKKYMIGVLIAIVFIMTVFNAFASADRHYLLYLKYNKSEIRTVKVDLMDGKFSQPKIFSDKVFIAEITDIFGNKLDSTRFTISLLSFADGFDLATGKKYSKTIELDSADFILRLPYYEMGGKIEIYDNESRKLASIDVSRHIITCGNGKCEIHEDFKICPVDCYGVSDGYCDRLNDGIIDIDCSSESFIEKQHSVENSGAHYAIYVIVLLIILLVMHFINKSRQTRAL